jgi:hypothetical protein
MADRKTHKAQEKPKKARERSPNYPAISLSAAVEKAKKLYQADGKAGGPPEAAIKHMGYGSLNGKSATVLSALGKYGLTANKGGRVVPTDVAIDIINFPPSHDRYKRAVSQAVQTPSIYRELIHKYGELGSIPSDDSLRPELITDMGFTTQAVGGFISDFKDSLRFAGLLDGNELKLSGSNGDLPDEDEVGDVDENEIEDEELTQTLDPPKTVEKAAKPLPPVPAGLKDFPLYTSVAKGALYSPSKMNKADFDLLKQQIESSLLVIAATCVQGDTPPN